MKTIVLTKSKKRTLLIKRKVSQINNSGNNDTLSESFNETFDYGAVSSVQELKKLCLVTPVYL